MKTFFLEIIKKLITSILLVTLFWVASYSLITGEFPPKISNIKNGVLNLQSQVAALRKMQEARLQKNLIPESVTADASTIKHNQMLLHRIIELEARVKRLEEQRRY